MVDKVIYKRKYFFFFLVIVFTPSRFLQIYLIFFIFNNFIFSQFLFKKINKNKHFLNTSHWTFPVFELFKDSIFYNSKLYHRLLLWSKNFE